jgi:hypothetical protein
VTRVTAPLRRSGFPLSGEEGTMDWALLIPFLLLAIALPGWHDLMPRAG